MTIDQFRDQHAIAMAVVSAGYVGVADAVAATWLGHRATVIPMLRAIGRARTAISIRDIDIGSGHGCVSEITDTSIEWASDVGLIDGRKFHRVRGRLGLGDWIEVERIFELDRGHGG